MSMEISGGYGRAAVDYAEQRKAGIGPKEAEEDKGGPKSRTVPKGGRGEKDIRSVFRSTGRVYQQ